MRWFPPALALALSSSSGCLIVLPGVDTDGSEETTGGTGLTTTERCDPFCEALLGPACPDGPTMEGCLLTCRSLTSSDVCNAKGHTYFDCVDNNDVVCDASGDPYAQGCGLVYLDAIACATTENPNPDVVTPCMDYCAEISTQACGNNEPEEDCNTNCLWFGNTGTMCDDEWGSYLDCANAANWSCLLGFAVPEMCGTEWDGYWTCIDNAGN